MSQIDWQTNGAYDAIQHHDALGFAWEFLRRNSDFTADIKALQTTGRRLPTNAQKEAFARKWGVRFCQTWEPPGRRNGALDGARSSQRGGPDKCQ